MGVESKRKDLDTPLNPFGRLHSPELRRRQKERVISGEKKKNDANGDIKDKKHLMEKKKTMIITMFLKANENE